VTASVADIHARIAALQARFALPTPIASAGPASGGRSITGASIDGLDFAAILADVTGGSVTHGATAGMWGLGGVSSGWAVQLDAAVGGSSPGGQQIVELAKRHLGVPYVWGGSGPRGFDCSGLVQSVYRQAGIDLPRTSREQAQAGQPVPSLAEARPGDLVAYGSPVDHIGIYAGNNTMVVAPHRGDAVKVQTIYRTPTAIRRVLPTDAAAGAATQLGWAALGG
jgi:cell wall-associated NlpC family hydrolase